MFIDPSPFESGATGGAPSSALVSGLDLLRSERVAQRVVENERLAEDPALRWLYLESIDAGRQPMEALAQYLAELVEVSAGGDGGLVRLAVTMRDPELAARVANAYAQAWGEVSLELRTASIRNGVARASQDLASLRARLGEARARRGNDGALVAAGARADEQFAQLSRLSAQPMGPRAAPPAAMGTAAMSTVVLDWAHKIAALSADSSGAPRFESVTAADDGQDAALRMAPLTDRRAAESTKSGDHGAALAPATSADEEIRLAQQSLERAEDRLARLSAESIGEPFPAHVLRPAQIPDTSTKPGWTACAGVGTALALLLGLLAVVIAENVDRRVRRASDLARGAGVVVLGDLPAVRSTGSMSGGREQSPSRWLRLHRAEA